MSSYTTVANANRWASLLVAVASTARDNGASLGSASAQNVAADATAAANKAVVRQAKASRAHDVWRARMKVTGWSLFAVAVVAALALGAFAPVAFAPWEFVLEMLLAVLAFVGVGLAVQGRMFGAAIDVRNRVSLSKLQMLAWTVLAVGALAALSGSWMRATGVLAPSQSTPPLIPGELLLAMGIAATSFVATPLLLSLKGGEQPTQDDLNDLAAARGTSLANVGKVDGRNDPGEASFADIFHGDEVGNATDVDLGKVQQIFITVLLLALYGAAIFNALEAGHGLIRHLPPMSDDFVKLLAISHASYLGYKAAPKTATAQN